MRAGLDEHARRTAVATVHAILRFFAENRLGEFSGEEFLADAGRTGEEVGVTEAAARDHVGERSGQRFMAANATEGHAPPPCKSAPEFHRLVQKHRSREFAT